MKRTRAFHINGVIIIADTFRKALDKYSSEFNLDSIDSVSLYKCPTYV